MHVHETIESVAHANRWTRRHVADKAVISGSLLALCLILPPWPWSLVAAAIAAAAALRGAGLRLQAWGLALKPVLLFIALGSVPLVFISGERALEAALRALGAGSAVMLFAATTPASEALASLQRCRPLAPLAEMAFLILRFTAVLRDVCRSMSIAFHCRAGSRRWTRGMLAAQAAASLTVRGFAMAHRAERLSALRCVREPILFWAPQRTGSAAFRMASAALLPAVCAAAYFCGEPLPWP